METVCNEVEVNHGLNIKRIRNAKQITIEVFAQKLGMTEQTVSKLENQAILDDTTLKKCAKILDIPVEVLEYMPASEEIPLQIFKDVKFVNSCVAGRQNTITNNYNDLGILEIFKEGMELLKAENKTLKEKLKSYEK